MNAPGFHSNKMLKTLDCNCRLEDDAFALKNPWLNTDKITHATLINTVILSF